MNTPYLLSERVAPTPPTTPNPERYEYLKLRDTEPNLGVPVGIIPALSSDFVLISTPTGLRSFKSTLRYDNVTTIVGTNSSFWQNTYLGVRANSGNWNSTYSTVFTNSGTWLTEPSASALFFKLSGGNLFGDMRIEGELVVVGVLSALGGIATTDTKVVETTALRIVNTGIGPALYVEQAGFDDIAQFIDTEGGVALHIGNIWPLGPASNQGVIGIKTTTPNEALTVKGGISATENIYTTGEFFSGGKSLDTIILESTPASLKSVFTTVSANSSSWSSVYNSWFSTSSRYTTLDTLSTKTLLLSSGDVLGDFRVFGSFFASGSSFLTNTIISTTSALSVINDDKGPALFVRQGGFGATVAEFYDSDFSSPVLYIGNAANPNGQLFGGVVGIRTSSPDEALTVAGTFSANTVNNLILYNDRGNIVAGNNVKPHSIGGVNNVLVGSEVATGIDFGIQNVCIGHQAGKNLFDGNDNISIGTRSGLSNINGLQNVFIGTDAGTNSSGGNYNIYLGSNTSSSVLNGSYNIHIGSDINLTGGPTSVDNTIIVGREARATRNQQMVIGTSIYRYFDSLFHGDISVIGTLSAHNTRLASVTAQDNSVFKNHVNIDRNLHVTGTANISGGLRVSSITSTGAITAVAGNTIINGDLEVTGAIRNRNTTSWSLTTGAIMLSGNSGAIVLDDGGHKRISWNDGAGNLNIRAGNYVQFVNSVYSTRYAIGADTTSSGGAATMTFSTDGQDGSINLYTAPIGTPDNVITAYSNQLSLNTTNAVLSSPLAVGPSLNTPVTLLDVQNRHSGSTLEGVNRYGGIHLRQTLTNDNFAGITVGATASSGQQTQGGILFQGSGSYGSKIFFLTSNNYSTGMLNRMVIDHNGDVGIGVGTSTPASKVEINHSSSNYTNGLTITNAANWGFGSRILFRVPLTNGGPVGNAASIDQGFTSSNNFNLSFFTCTAGTLTQRLQLQPAGTALFSGPTAGSNPTINSSGDILIGSGGTLFFDGNYSYGLGNYIGPRTGANTLSFHAGGNERLRIDGPNSRVIVYGQGSALTLSNDSLVANAYTQMRLLAGTRSAYLWIRNENSTADAGAGGLNIYTENGNMDFWTNAVQRARFTTTGHFIPIATNSYDLGSSSNRWRNLFTNDLHLSNAFGDYTVVEGEDNLYLINNKKNKTYKFALIEVDPSEVPPRSS